MYILNEKMHFFTLRFLDEDIEKDYFEYFFRKSIPQIRVALVVGHFLYAVFGILDGYIIPESLTWALIIRYAIITPVHLAVLLFSFSALFKRFMQLTLTVAILSAGFGIIAILQLATSPGNYQYYTGLILIIMYAYTFIKLRFIYATLGCWMLVFAYEIAIVLTKPMPLPFLLNISFFLLSANLIGMFSCYQTELSLRQDFLQQKRLRELEQKKHLMEKEKMLKDLHDGVGGIATSIAILADIAQKEPSLPDVKKTLFSISELADESISEIRSFLRSLDTKELTWQALSAELRYRGASLMEPCGVSFRMCTSISDGLDPPGSLLYLNLFKIYREALTNVLKHSRASRVDVEVVVEPHMIRISIHDNGIGFSAVRTEGRGVENMRARVAEIGGTLHVTNKDGTEVVIIIQIP